MEEKKNKKMEQHLADKLYLVFSKKKWHLISYFVLFFFLLFFVSGCNIKKPNPYKLSQEDYQALKDFFEGFLFREGGVYTLFGEKPITFDILSDFSTLEEEGSLPKIKNSWLNGWKKVSHRLKTPLFLLTERSSPFSKENRAVFLVNIEATASMLKTRYSEFRNFIGYDFDPLSIVFDIEDSESIFWDKILTDDYFLGLVLGYGDINAWLHKCCFEDYKNGKFGGKNQDKIKAFLSKILNRTPTSHNFANCKEDILFALPTFGCFNSRQSLFFIKKYKKDRERIRKIYKGKDLITVTLDRLTSKDFPKEPNERYIKLFKKTYKNTEIMPVYHDPDLTSDEN